MSTDNSPAPVFAGSGAQRPAFLEEWHRVFAARDADGLRALVSPNSTFRSPAVYTPQIGPEITYTYLLAAMQVLGPTIEYEHEWFDDSSAVLKFKATVDEFEIQGVDIVEWDAEGKIGDFTVMVRPFKGLQAVINKMGQELSRKS